ncbi:Profilin/allergen [Westerdykella ornata]|uniref:Profilin n=1 Tax=Westerdykella ornata TaxID=318751 RepID=A0A6A6JCF7_WESOR|nr:Profilin/allergen [Westerdykella ornata]KAF2274112.1 Profilin/allergen [Westerdykella ornata]
MSWQAYVDQSLLGTGNIDKALIAGLDGTVWAHSAGFSIPPAELKVIIDSFSDTSNPPKIVSEGIKVNGEKYMTISADNESLKAKKGKEGLVAAKTVQAVLIGHHNEEITTPAAFNSVVELQEYLKKMGY